MGIVLIIETSSEREVAQMPFSDNLGLSSLVVCSVSDNLLGCSLLSFCEVEVVVDESSSDTVTLFKDISVRFDYQLIRSEIKIEKT